MEGGLKAPYFTGSYKKKRVIKFYKDKNQRNYCRQQKNLLLQIVCSLPCSLLSYCYDQNEIIILCFIILCFAKYNVSFPVHVNKTNDFLDEIESNKKNTNFC